MDNFGKRIAKQRKKVGLTQNSLAEKLMVSNKSVSKWESGIGYPSFEFLPKLCELLDCSADYLILGEHSFEHYKKVKNGIVVNIGTNEKGQEHFEDILKFPHLLVIGESGSGKSCLFHSFIIDIIKKYSPEKVKLGLIDCKKNEFGLYDYLPHLISPIAKNTENATQLLENIMIEMDNRFSLFQDMQIRNIFEYNKISKEKMPFIVLIIDELAEVVQNQRAKKILIHLIKLARASGIHIILGTQRLRSDTLPYQLKEFILTRICFKVDVKQQSEEYFNFAGGEKLSGKGEMLFYKSSYNELLKLQGKYYSQDDIISILKQKQIPFDQSTQFDDLNLESLFNKMQQFKGKINTKI